MRKTRRIRSVAAMGLPLAVLCPAVADVIETRISPVNGHTYRLIAAPGGGGKTWAAAEAEAITLGGHLATIRSEAENTWAAATFRRLRGALWIGLNDAAEEGTFVWTSGEPVTYTNWGWGEPNGGTAENHVVLFAYSPNAHWNDIDGLWTEPYGIAETVTTFQRYNWNDPAGGVFSTAGKWTPPGPPGANDGAYFNLNATYTVQFTAPATTALAVVEKDDVTFNLGGKVYNVTETYVGHSMGTSRLTLSGGGGSTLLDTYATVGMVPGDHGTVVVNGANWQTGDTLWVGYGGTGYLDVTAGTVGAKMAVFGQSIGSVGDGTIRGASSSLAVLGNLMVGLQGTASLSVLNDADVTAARVYIGDHFGSTGAVTIRGYGSALMSANEIVVAAEGLGTLTVEEAGFVTGTTVEVGGGWGDGHVLVTNYGSMLVASNNIVVGRGGNGVMVIDDGASVQAVNATVGMVPGSSGAIAVSGGATLTVTDWLTVGEWGDGNLSIGGGGGGPAALVSKSGRLRVGAGYGSSGAIATVGRLNVGSAPGGFGRVSVLGLNSELTVSSGDTIVGDWGWGSLTVEEGATLANNMGWGLVGVMPGASGEVLVSDPGSTWTIASGHLVVGDAAYGHLTIRNGGQVFVNGDVHAGRSEQGYGTIVVSGAGSVLDASGHEVILGDLEFGQMYVAEGAQVRTDRLYLGRFGAGSRGEMHLSGPGSQLHVADFVGVGENGAGRLQVADGAEVNVGRYLAIRANSEVVLDGGTINVPAIGFESPSSSLIGHGTVNGRITASDMSSIQAAYGTLRIGDAADPYGAEFNGYVYVHDNATLELLDSQNAVISGGGLVLANGAVIARNGLLLWDTPPTGYGVIVGRHNSRITNPSDTVNRWEPLDVGAQEARVYSAGPAVLGPLTTLAGGTLTASRGLRVIDGGVLAGRGKVVADVTLENGVIDAEEGATMQIVGALRGYGVTIGNVVPTAGIITPTGTVSLDEPLNVGPRRAVVHSMWPASLGASIAGGTIEAPNGLYLRASHRIEGVGSVNADITLTDGTLRASGGTLWVNGGISGYGFLIGDVQPWYLVPPSGTATVPPEADAGSDLVTVYSAGPALVLDQWMLSGATVVADHGIAVEPGGMIRGFGDVHGPVYCRGTIVSEGGTMTFHGAIDLQAEGAIRGEAVELSSTAQLFLSESSERLTVDQLINYGLIQGRGRIQAATLITNANTIAMSGMTDFLGDVSNIAGAKVIAAGGLPTTFWDDVDNEGTITAGENTVVVYYGSVSGSGSFDGPGKHDIRGDLHPGSSPGTMTFSNVSFGSTARLHIELAGTATGNGYDQVNVTGTAQLNGTLEVSVSPPFRPAHNDVFQILTFGTRSGDFASKNGLDLGSRLVLVPAYGTNDLTLTAVQGGPGAWRFDISGLASVPTNWAGGFPNGVGDVATFGSVISTPRTVSVNSPLTWGGMAFNSAQSYSVGGTGPITLDVAAGSASIQVSLGQHSVAAPVVLADPLGIAVAEGAALSLGAIENVSGKTITKTGPGLLIIGGTQTHGAGAMLLANGGTTVLSTDGGSQLAASVAPGARLEFGATQHLGSLTVTGDGKISSGGNRVLVTETLSIAGAGRLNLTDNDLIVGTGDPATVRGWLISGYNNGAWNGPGIMSDAIVVQRHALGYAAGNDPNIAGLGGKLGGESFDSNAVIVKFTYAGDANLDGQVDVVDLGILATHWQGTGKGWTRADFNYSPDGKVDVVDLGILATSWQRGVGNPLGLSFREALAQFAELSDVTVVPEPASGLLLAVGASTLLLRRRRR